MGKQQGQALPPSSPRARMALSSSAWPLWPSSWHSARTLCPALVAAMATWAPWASRELRVQAGGEQGRDSEVDAEFQADLCRRNHPLAHSLPTSGCSWGRLAATKP